MNKHWQTNNKKLAEKNEVTLMYKLTNDQVLANKQTKTSKNNNKKY